VQKMALFRTFIIACAWMLEIGLWLNVEVCSAQQRYIVTFFAITYEYAFYETRKSFTVVHAEQGDEADVAPTKPSRFLN